MWGKSLSAGETVKLVKTQVKVQNACPPSHFPKLSIGTGVYWSLFLGRLWSLVLMIDTPVTLTQPNSVCRVVWWIQTRPSLSSLDQARNLQVYYTQTWHELTQIPLQYFNVFQRHLSPVQSQMIQKKVTLQWPVILSYKTRTRMLYILDCQIATTLNVSRTWT